MLLVVFRKDGFFGDFECVPAFEAAVVFSLGLFVFWLCGAGLLRCGVVVVGGGLGFFWLEAFQEELKLSGVDFFAFHSVEDLD